MYLIINNVLHFVCPFVCSTTFIYTPFELVTSVYLWYTVFRKDVLFNAKEMYINLGDDSTVILMFCLFQTMYTQ